MTTDNPMTLGFRIELEFKYVAARKKTNNKFNRFVASTRGFEPGHFGWEAESFPKRHLYSPQNVRLEGHKIKHAKRFPF